MQNRRNRRAKRGKDFSLAEIRRRGLSNTIGTLNLLARNAEHDPRAAAVVSEIRRQYWDEIIIPRWRRLRESDRKLRY